MLAERSPYNPVLKPNISQSWESEAVFNGCPVRKGRLIYLLYRAVSVPHFHAAVNAKLAISDIGIAESRDGINFTNRRRFIIPDKNWDKYGCEDPRITKLKNKYYIFYTAISE
ncbi:MAG: glycosidase, partial [bacterium]|nr:glycosidase [bacterium]